MTEIIEEVNEKELAPKEVKIEDLTQEELIQLCKDKDHEIGMYKNAIAQVQGSNKELVENYNEDMSYMSTINSNLVKIIRKKEDSITKIISGALELMTIDRDEIAPARKENN